VELLLQLQAKSANMGSLFGRNPFGRLRGWQASMLAPPYNRE
jgi:hypothetical protein